MPKFGRKSLDILATCHPDLQLVCNEAIKLYDFTVLEGYRPKDKQDKAVEEGRSKTPWPISKHNTMPSRAVDIAPYPVNWNNPERFFFLAGIMLGISAKLGKRLRWGGDFNMNGDFDDQSFKDLPHFELIGD